MNCQPGPSRSAAAHTTGSNHYSNLYGDGAPHGDRASFLRPSPRPLSLFFSFNVPAPTGGPVFRDARSLGHGPPPPNTPRAFRSTSLDTSQAFPRHGATLNHGRTASQPVYDPSLVTTPTPNRYNIPSRPPAAARPQFVIPEERTQMEHLLDMMQMLLNGQAELIQHMSDVESALYQQRQQPSVPARGMTVQRGGRVTRSRRATSGHSRPATTPTSNESDPDASQPATTPDCSDIDRESENMDDDGMTLDAIDLSKQEKRALQGLTVSNGGRNNTISSNSPVTHAATPRQSSHAHLFAHPIARTLPPAIQVYAFPRYPPSTQQIARTLLRRISARGTNHWYHTPGTLGTQHD
ncbi:hypothetical protein B0H13DRAFT_2307101 [Mycena leptocephala]|nr:hypothetical protein B0H13DRAFT_2307101 [Mycena leptocephala]